jgi:hypothetical protein
MLFRRVPEKSCPRTRRSHVRPPGATCPPIRIFACPSATSTSCQLPFSDRIKGEVFMARVLVLITLAIGVPIAMVAMLIP